MVIYFTFSQLQFRWRLRLYSICSNHFLMDHTVSVCLSFCAGEFWVIECETRDIKRHHRAYTIGRRWCKQHRQQERKSTFRMFMSFFSDFFFPFAVLLASPNDNIFVHGFQLLSIRTVVFFSIFFMHKFVIPFKQTNCKSNYRKKKNVHKRNFLRLFSDITLTNGPKYQKEIVFGIRGNIVLSHTRVPSLFSLQFLFLPRFFPLLFGRYHF